MQICYLDNNATTRVAPQVLAEMTPWFVEDYGNASSLHVLGERAADALARARARVARLIGARSPEQVVFTSGGTESDNAALHSALRRSPDRRRIVVSAVEHEAVLAPLARLESDGYEIVRIAPDREGHLDPARFFEAIDERCALAAVMAANNETGALHDWPAIGEHCAARGVPFHVDAVQWVGKLPLDVAAHRVDTLAISAHKFHGPKGIGALYLRDPKSFQPWIHGGGQEQQRRAGTENLPAIVGFGAAAESATQWLAQGGPARVAARRDALQEQVVAALAGVRVHAGRAPRTCNTLNLGFDDVSGEALVMLLSEFGVCASAGSACASSRHAPSHVLLAMGFDEPSASRSLRLSLSRETTDAEVAHAVDAVVKAVQTLRALAGVP